MKTLKPSLRTLSVLGYYLLAIECLYIAFEPYNVLSITSPKKGIIFIAVGLLFIFIATRKVYLYQKSNK